VVCVGLLDDVTVRLGADDRKARKGITGFGGFLDKNLARWSAEAKQRAKDFGSGFGEDLVKGAKPGAAALTKMMLSATAMGQAAAGAAQLAGAIAPIAGAAAGAAAALPAIAAGAIAAGGAAKLAFAGVGDAIAGDEEALEKLAGPAREFVGVVEDLKPAWEDVQKSVQGTFFEGLSDTFEEAATTVLPHLKTGLVGVADGLSDVAAAALDAADSPRFLQGMDAVLASTADGLAIAAEGTGGFVRGAGVLLESFAPLLRLAGAAAADLGEQFETLMAEAQRSGQLRDLMSTMLVVFSQLGGIVANVGSILGSVFGAAAQQGGGLLGTLESLTGQVADFLSSTQGQEALSALFTTLATIGAALGPVLLAVADAFATGLAPIIGEIALNVGPALVTVAEAIGDALKNVDVGQLAGAFADLLVAVAPLLPKIGELITMVFDIAAEFIAFALVFEPILGPLGALLDLIVMLEPVITPLAIALGIWTAAQWLLNIAMLANPIILIVTLILGLIAAIAWIATETTFFQDLWDACWGGIKAAAKAVVDWWTGTFVPALQSGLNAIKSGITSAKDWIVSKFNAVIDFFKSVPDKISSATSGMWNGIKDAFKSAINWLIGKWNGLSFSVPSIDMGPLGSVGGFTVSTPNIPMLAKGGIATGPTLAMIGEGRYDEAVVPLPRGARDFARNGGGGGPTEITIYLDGDEDMIRMLRKGIQARGGDVVKVLGV
jgi:hypothetical protein